MVTVQWIAEPLSRCTTYFLQSSPHGDCLPPPANLRPDKLSRPLTSLPPILQSRSRPAAKRRSHVLSYSGPYTRLCELSHSLSSPLLRSSTRIHSGTSMSCRSHASFSPRLASQKSSSCTFARSSSVMKQSSCTGYVSECLSSTSLSDARLVSHAVHTVFLYKLIRTNSSSRSSLP